MPTKTGRLTHRESMALMNRWEAERKEREATGKCGHRSGDAFDCDRPIHASGLCIEHEADLWDRL